MKHEHFFFPMVPQALSYPQRIHWICTCGDYKCTEPKKDLTAPALAAKMKKQSEETMELLKKHYPFTFDVLEEAN